MSVAEPSPPSAGSQWYKAHGLGNDYLVVEEGSHWTLRPAAIEAFCHRTRGVGGDGVVLLLSEDPGRPFSLRMFNPDGSEFERSGNGLRVLASYLCRSGRVALAQPFEVRVGGQAVVMEIHGVQPEGIYDVSVEMGPASVGPEAVGLDPHGPGARGVLEVAEVGPVSFEPVSVGNPHAVVFTEELSHEALHRLGPGLATHRAFPRGTNVQLARVRPGAGLEIMIWERGVGPTSASGTSACAVAVAAVRGGRLDPGEIEVRMEGGLLLVTVTPSLEVTLRGPVQEVSTGKLAEGFLRSLGGTG